MIAWHGSGLQWLAAVPFAEVTATGDVDWSRFGFQLAATIIYILIGLAMFAFAFLFLAKVVKIPIRKEIEQDQNIALAILIGSAIIGFAMIVASAVRGG
jgi:putative membrane protein